MSCREKTPLFGGVGLILCHCHIDQSQGIQWQRLTEQYSHHLEAFQRQLSQFRLPPRIVQLRSRSALLDIP